MTSDDRFATWLPEGLKADALSEPSTGALRQAIALAAAHGRGERSWFALLCFDSAAAMPAGVRQVSAVDRRLLFRLHPAEPEGIEHQLDLHLRQLPDGDIDLAGQVLPALPGAVVSTEAGRKRRRKALGKGGDFLIRRAAGADERIVLTVTTVDGSEVRLADLGLDPDPPPEP